MRVLLFGATGMVGQGVLRDCLLAADVQEVVAVGRTPLTQEHNLLHNQVLHEQVVLLTVVNEDSPRVPASPLSRWIHSCRSRAGHGFQAPAK